MAEEGTKTGRELERRVAQAYRDIGARKVEHDVELAGHQIDVYVELETADRSLHRIAVEAKDYDRPVGIKIVSDYSSVVDRLRRRGLIDEGVIVSAAGFSKQARNAAEDEDIRLMVPADLARIQEVEQNEPRISDSMWIALVDIIKQQSKEVSRENLVRSVVNLRSEMTLCQRLYRRYEASVANSDEEHIQLALRDDWINSIESLGFAVEELDRVLSIFSPETREIIGGYWVREAVTADIPSAIGKLSPAAEELGGSTDFDIENVSVEPSFEAALELLDRFIRENFTPEEIHSAR